MTGRSIASPGQPPSSPAERLAAVARERASEQSAKAVAASDPETASLHREQEAYLVRLAEVYERRAVEMLAAA